MCTSSLIIKNKSVYKTKDSFCHYEVPCGKCESCMSLTQKEWEIRLCYESQRTLSSGGVVIFLTFTYSPEHLPIYNDGDFSIDCFNHDHVKSFLNNLKVKIYRLYGEDAYKYFWCSEYGKDTQRPHYHCEFFLSKGVDPHTFAEICRDTWFYGYMFPKYDSRKCCYVDNFGQPTDIICRNVGSTCWYVGKYATKDIFYLNREDLKYYLSLDLKNKYKMKTYLPKHFQSKGLGSSICDTINMSNINEVCLKGIQNPFTKKFMPLPTYVINKLCYKNVKSSTLNPRYSEFSGKLLYDRVLTDFGKVFYSHKFDAIKKRLQTELSEIFISYPQSFDGYLCPTFLLQKLKIDIYVPDSFSPIADYIISFRFLNSSFIEELDYFYNFPLTTSIAKQLYLHSKDFIYKYKYQVSNIRLDDFLTSLKFRDYDIIYRYYKYIKDYKNLDYVSSEVEKFELIKHLRRKYMSKYDLKLC